MQNISYLDFYMDYIYFRLSIAISPNEIGFSTFAFPKRLCAKGLARGSSEP